MSIFDVPIFWGGLRLWAESGDVDVSRTLVPHELAQGDAHPLHDAGLAARPLRLSLLFDEFAGEDLSPEDRLQRLLELHRGGRAHMLSHPLEGNFLAKIGQLQYRHDEDSVLTADVTFYPTEDDTPVSPAGAGVPSVAGEASVDVAADELEDAAADLDEDLEEDAIEIASASRSAVARWKERADNVSRAVMTDVADITSRIATFITEHHLEDDIAKFEVWLAAIMVGDAVRSAAIGATSEVSTTFAIRISETVVLLALCAQIYGGIEAETRERQVCDLNDLRSPTWIGPGEFVFPGKNS